MAELVDALDSKSGFRKRVQVRFLFRAPVNQSLRKACFDKPFLFANNLQTNSDLRCKELFLFKDKASSVVIQDVFDECSKKESILL